MFCVLKTEIREKTFFEKILGKNKKTQYLLKTIPVLKGAPFYEMTVVLGRKGVDWNCVVQILGKCSKKLVVQDTIELPKREDVGIHKSNLLKNKIYKNTFNYILKNQKALFDICVIDRKGENTDFVENICECAKTLTISTNKKEKYQKTCEILTLEKGVCPLIQEKIADSTVKIDLDANLMTIKTSKDYLNIKNGEEFILHNIYENLLCDGVDKYDFFSALYELCGVFSIGDSIFENIEVNNEKKLVKHIQFA